MAEKIKKITGMAFWIMLICFMKNVCCVSVLIKIPPASKIIFVI